MTTASPSLIRRLAPYLSARVRQNSRLLSSTSAVPEPQSASIEPPARASDAVHMTDSCVRRMKELQADEGSKKLLRLSIEAGGCSGFQYNFSLVEKTNSDDRIFEQDGVKLVVDNISFDFVKGATVDYVEELIRSAFQVGFLEMVIFRTMFAAVCISYIFIPYLAGDSFSCFVFIEQQKLCLFAIFILQLRRFLIFAILLSLTSVSFSESPPFFELCGLWCSLLCLIIALEFFQQDTLTLTCLKCHVYT